MLAGADRRPGRRRVDAAVGAGLLVRVCVGELTRRPLIECRRRIALSPRETQPRRRRRSGPDLVERVRLFRRTAAALGWDFAGSKVRQPIRVEGQPVERGQSAGFGRRAGLFNTADPLFGRELRPPMAPGRSSSSTA
jgi:hypothetical protein